MRDGFIKVAAGTPDIRVADCAYNAQQCVELMRRAGELGGGVTVRGTPDQAMKVLRAAGLSKLMKFE